MWSGNELISFTREYMHEEEADFWTPTKLLATLNAAQKQIVLKMQRAADKVFYDYCTIPTVSGTQRYLLPNGTLYTAAKKCTGKIDELFDANKNRITKGDWRTFHRATTRSPREMVIVGNYLYLDPIPNAVQNLILWYWYFPTAITATGTEIDFLEGFEPLIAMKAAITSIVKDEADLSDLRIEYAELWADFKDTYCGNRIEGSPDSIPSDIEDPDD